jgi:hypothetical protein
LKLSVLVVPTELDVEVDVTRSELYCMAGVMDAEVSYTNSELLL